MLQWTQTMLQVGEAFSSSESSTLRDALQRHSGRFFLAFHAANVQALHSMLEQELWKRLPMPADRRPSLAASLEAGMHTRGGSTMDTNSFEAWAMQGNPWSKQTPG